MVCIGVLKLFGLRICSRRLFSTCISRKKVSQTTEPPQCILLWLFVHMLLGGLLITISLWHLSIDLSALFEVSPCHRSSTLPIFLFSHTPLMTRPAMNGLTAFPEVLGLVLSLSSCVQYTSAAAIAIASTESNRVPHPADITDSHVKPTEVVNLRSTISAASLNWAIIPTINPDHLSWLERDRSSSTASGPSAASATTNMSSKTATASSEAAVSSDELITRTIATRWPDSLFDTNLPVPRPLTETPEYVVAL